MVLPSDELVLRAAILATGIIFGYAIFELMHRVLLPKRPIVEENKDMWPAEVDFDIPHVVRSEFRDENKKNSYDQIKY